jgi:DegV family protein with EDD domain
MKFRIVVDSSADLVTAKDRSVVSVPMKIMTDNKEYVDDENLDIQGMTDDLAAYHGKSGSACPGVGDWIDAFGDADRVFCITITSNLSGSYNSAMVAKETFESENPGKKVCVIDSLSAGPELKIIKEKIESLLEEGKTYEDICEIIAEYQKSTYLVFMLKSLTNLANNGRVSPAVAKIAGVLGIHVMGIASTVGTLEQKAKCRGEKKAILAMWRQMKELGYKGGKVIIDHCFNEEAAKQLSEMIKSEFADAVIQISTTNGLCSFYAEQGGMLVGIEC